MRSEIIDIPRPTFTISHVGMLQGAAAIAFGGVDTGRQQEYEQHRATGIIKYMG